MEAHLLTVAELEGKRYVKPVKVEALEVSFMRIEAGINRQLLNLTLKFGKKNKKFSLQIRIPNMLDFRGHPLDN
jgi:hypothetical protein